jgi:hypothetical protein
VWANGWHSVQICIKQTNKKSNKQTTKQTTHQRHRLHHRYVDQIPRAIKGTVKGIIDKKKELDNVEHVMKILDLNHITERDIADLSGGELQRFAMAIVCIQKADVYMFDEPSSYVERRRCYIPLGAWTWFGLVSHGGIVGFVWCPPPFCVCVMSCPACTIPQDRTRRFCPQLTLFSVLACLHRYLDVKQRLNAGIAIRGLLRRKGTPDARDEDGMVIQGSGADFKENYVICVEHDLSILDYLSDYICCL